MKAESTIRRMIRRLRAIAEDARESRERRDEAYCAYHALWWVIARPDWAPIDLLPLPPKRESERRRRIRAREGGGQ